jgi:hypothetical protein
MWMTAFAFDFRGARFGESGELEPEAACASFRFIPKIEDKLSAPNPIPVFVRKSLRVAMISSREGRCSRRYFSEFKSEGSGVIGGSRGWSFW